MAVLLTDEQRFVQEAAQDALGRVASLERIRGALDAGELDDLWPTAVEAGWTGLLVSEDHDGAGLGAPEAALVMAELGRTLAEMPLLGHLVATGLLQRLGDDEELLGALARGEKRAAAVLSCDAVKLDGAAVSGRAKWVPDADGADVLVVAAGTTYADGWLAVWQLRFLLVPVVMLLLALLLRWPRWWLASVFILVLGLQVVLALETGYLIPACAIVIVGYEVTTARPPRWHVRNFPRVTWCAIAGSITGPRSCRAYGPTSRPPCCGSSSPRSAERGSGRVSPGGVSERPKEHASKACEGKTSVGSNPTATANKPDQAHRDVDATEHAKIVPEGTLRSMPLRTA